MFLETDDTVWEWQNDDESGWVQYSVEVSRFIEQERCCGNTVIDLSKKFRDLPYIMDLTQMTQKRKETGRLRFIRTQPAHFDSSKRRHVYVNQGNDIEMASGNTGKINKVANM